MSETPKFPRTTPHIGETAGTPHAAPTPHTIPGEVYIYEHEGDPDYGVITPHAETKTTDTVIGTPHTTGRRTTPHAERPRTTGLEEFPNDEVRHNKARRIGHIRRMRTLRAIGRAARQHNRNLAGRINPEDGTTYGYISSDVVLNNKTYVRHEIRRSNREYKRILGNRVLNAVGFGRRDTKARITAHSKNRAAILKPVVEGMTWQGRAQPKHIARKTAAKIAERNANPNEGDFVITRIEGGRTISSVVSGHVWERSRQASRTPEIYGKKPKKPNRLTRDDLPVHLKSDDATLVIRDIRNKYLAAIELARREARAQGVEFDKKSARKVIMKNLTMGKAYHAVGGEMMRLRDPETAKIINRALRMDDDKFEEVFPKPVRARRVVAHHSGADLETSSHSATPHAVTGSRFPRSESIPHSPRPATGSMQGGRRVVAGTASKRTPELTPEERLNWAHILDEGKLKKLDDKIEQAIKVAKDAKLDELNRHLSDSHKLSELPPDKWAALTEEVRGRHLDAYLGGRTDSIPPIVLGEINKMLFEIFQEKKRAKSKRRSAASDR